MKFDAIIVGAGAAGLAAARSLARAGWTTLVLEARERPGGRIASIVDPRAIAAIELGPEFVHGRPAVTLSLLDEIGTSTVDDEGSSFEIDASGQLSLPEDDPFESASAVLRRGLKSSVGESVADLLARETTPEGKRDALLAAHLVGGFDAADPARASAREIAEEWSSDATAGGTQSRPIGGYAPLVAHLVQALDRERVHFRFGAIVQRIAWSSNGVEVTTRVRGTPHVFYARYAIVTVPVGVLQLGESSTGAIAFEPALPSVVADAIAKIAMGPVVKVILRFRTAFWERIQESRLRDGAFFSTTSGSPFPTYWTQLPQRVPTLTAWAGGPAAAALAAFDRDATVALALAGAGTLFDAAALADEECEATYYHDWQRDPFARGAYSYVIAGGEGARRRLGAPLQNGALIFAGEATATDGEGGTVAGALQSGERAAHVLVSSRG